MRTRRGVSAIEFSLVISVLLAILLGLVDWSWYMVQFLDVGVAVSRGARIAAGDATDPEGAAAAAVCASMEAYHLACDPTAVQVHTVADASGQAMTVSYEMVWRAPVGLVPSPDRIRATASTSWYGYLYQYARAGTLCHDQAVVRRARSCDAGRECPGFRVSYGWSGCDERTPLAYHATTTTSRNRPSATRSSRPVPSRSPASSATGAT